MVWPPSSYQSRTIGIGSEERADHRPFFLPSSSPCLPDTSAKAKQKGKKKNNREQGTFQSSINLFGLFCLTRRRTV
jgi:hypothetical protein